MQSNTAEQRDHFAARPLYRDARDTHNLYNHGFGYFFGRAAGDARRRTLPSEAVKANEWTRGFPTRPDSRRAARSANAIKLLAAIDSTLGQCHLEESRVG